MGMENGQLLEDNGHYEFVLAEDRNTLLFGWKYVEGLSTEDFRRGISEFAERCRTHKPARAAIDARALDQRSPAMSWLRAQDTDTREEPYTDWWAREIMPVFHDAGISSLAVATGDPNAPGELTQRPPGVKFRIGYFPDLESTLLWNLA